MHSYFLFIIIIFFFSSETRDIMLHFLNSKRGQWSQNDILIYFFKSLYYFSHHFEPSWCHNQINSSFGIPIQANAQINVSILVPFVANTKLYHGHNYVHTSTDTALCLSCVHIKKSNKIIMVSHNQFYLLPPVKSISCRSDAFFIIEIL